MDGLLIEDHLNGKMEGNERVGRAVELRLEMVGGEHTKKCCSKLANLFSGHVSYEFVLFTYTLALLGQMSGQERVTRFKTLVSRTAVR